MCVMRLQISLICLCRCVLSLDCCFNQMVFLNTCKKYQITAYSFNWCRSSLLWEDNHQYVVQFIPHQVNWNINIHILYYYINIGGKEGTRMWCVYFIEIRSESCNYTFIDRRYIYLLNSLNFRILIFLQYICMQSFRPPPPLYKIGPLLRKTF